MSEPKTILCLASFYKGNAFLESCKQQGAYVILLTKEEHRQEDWARHAIDEVYYMPSLVKQPDITNAIGYLMRSRRIDQLIALDDYDVPTIGDLREHFRLPGMGATALRLYRDKLAMRIQARAGTVTEPDFSPLFNYEQLHAFLERTPAPWILKPRTEAGSMGVKKINNNAELWSRLNQLGDEQSHFLLEQFLPGDVYHVDSLIQNGQIIFSIASKYAQPPMHVSHDGGVFVTRVLPREGEEATILRQQNEKLQKALGMKNGVSHTEFIRAHADSQFYFLETAARVGGANISDMIEQATGINLWAEWAKLELAQLRGQTYQLPNSRTDYAGVLICLARQERPNLWAYNDPEVVWRLDKKYHAGLIIASPDSMRIEYLLQQYHQRFAHDFLTVAPPKEKADV